MAEKHRPLEVRDVPVANLLVDLLNPRLAEQKTQRDAIRALFTALGDRILNLAEDIVQEGLDPSSLSIVIPDENDGEMFVAVEGNRRLGALKVLGRPDLVLDLLSKPQTKRLRALSDEYLKTPISHVTSVVFAEREAADHWIELRHTGAQSGRGIMEWGGAEAARFAERRGRTARSGPALDALELVRKKGRLPKNALDRLDRVPITTVQRLLNDPDVRERIGVEIENGRLLSRLPEAEILKALTRIIRDAALGHLKVTHIDSKHQRAGYIDKFEPSELPSPTSRPGPAPHPVGTEDQGKVSAKRPPNRAKVSSHTRHTIVPRTFGLSIDDTKTNNIFWELKHLKIEGQPSASFPHAGSVLFRVFLELSVDRFVRKHVLISAKDIDNQNLKQKFQAVEKYLRENQRMTANDLRGPRRVTDENHFLAASIRTLHGYVHDPHFSPGPADLKAAWDTLELFFKTIFAE
jgi:hypothetical protein